MKFSKIFSFESGQAEGKKEEGRDELLARRAELQKRLDLLEKEMAGPDGVPEDVRVHEELSTKIEAIDAKLRELGSRN